MSRCLELAALAEGNVSPNPLVGAMIVCDGRIIGEGYHQRYGGAHAEVNAVHDALDRNTNGAELLKRSAIYVNLEPCSHHGKTPPCTDLIIRHQIPRVIVGCRDPFAQVNGKGIEKLRAAAVQVTEGVLEEQSRWLNRRFFTRVQQQRPYIILKWAQTADGYFAPQDGTQCWITSAVSKKIVHRVRSREDAVLVGKNTALIDNPRLNVRHWAGKNPVRIVIDRRLELPHTLNLFDQTQPTIIFNEQKTDHDQNIRYLQLEDFDHYLPQLIAYQLYLLDIQSLIVEGGVKTLHLFLDAGLWNEALVFTGPQTWGSGLKAPAVAGTLYSEDQAGEDRLQIWHNS